MVRDTQLLTAVPSARLPAQGHETATSAWCEITERVQELLRTRWLDVRPAWTDGDWWHAPLRPEVRALLWLPVGPHLAEGVATAARGPSCPSPHTGESPPGAPAPGHAVGWPCACQVVLAAAWEACAAWCAAGAAVALVDAVGPRPVAVEMAMSGGLVDPAREELAVALRLTPSAMGSRIKSARDLVAHPALVDLVASAGISAWAARLVVLELADLTDEQAREVVDDVCAKIAHRRASGKRAWTSAEVGRAARLARRRVCPEGDQGARERAFAQRRVQVFPDQNGMATVVADLDSTDAHRIHRRLSAIAAGLADPTESRTRDQLRADILVDLLLGSPGDSRAGSGVRSDVDDNPGDDGHARPGASLVHNDLGADGASGRDAPADDAGHGLLAGRRAEPASSRPEIQVIVTLETLMGLTNDPAEIPGLGPVSAAVARELAADGQWRSWIADASGAIVATGSRGYVPSAGLARLVRAREPYCRMPGCRQPSTRCDLDHTIPYPRGSTSAANLGPLCRRHHVMKTHAGWQLDPSPPSADQSRPPAWRWRTPAGFTVPDEVEPIIATA